MKITQAFLSADDEHLISEIELGASQATPIPVTGDDVSWVADGNAYKGRVKSRLISYSSPDRVELERLDAVDISAVLRVELINS
jgi:hypothetical protein